MMVIKSFLCFLLRPSALAKRLNSPNDVFGNSGNFGPHHLQNHMGKTPLYGGALVKKALGDQSICQICFLKDTWGWAGLAKETK